MFEIIDIKNIDKYSSSFFPKEIVQTELEHNPFGKYLVYKEKNEILGYIYYSEIYERIEINQFIVDPSHRNCGIGSKLMKELTEHIGKGITLEVSCNNEVAIHLYKKYGFQEKAVRKGYYNGTDGILMERNSN